MEKCISLLDEISNVARYAYQCGEQVDTEDSVHSLSEFYKIGLASKVKLETLIKSDSSFVEYLSVISIYPASNRRFI